MALYTHAHEVRPLKPQLPAFGSLQGFDVMHLAGISTTAFQLGLALVATRLQLRSACLLPRLRPSEHSNLGGAVALAVVASVVLLPHQLSVALPGCLSVRFGYRLALVALSQAAGYQRSTTCARFHCHAVPSSLNSSRHPTSSVYPIPTANKKENSLSAALLSLYYITF